METRAYERVVSLDADLVASNARLLAAALSNDPAYGYLFPELATRRAGLEDFFTRNQRTHLPHRCTYVALGEHGESFGTVTLRPPGGIRISMLTMIRRGLLPFALRHGRSAVKRLLWLKATYDALEAEAAHGEPHLLVHMMAVRPELQGRGLGTRLLRTVLDRALSERPRTRVVLTTHLPENVVFYRRAGFDVTHERELTPPGSAPYTVWSMARAE